MQTRRQLLAAGAGIMAGAITLADAPPALGGAGSKFYTPLRLTSSGGVVAGGPLVMESDDRSAVVHARIVQAGRVAEGLSPHYQHGASVWWAGCAPLDGPLESGAAIAYGVQDTRTDAGVIERYRWQMHVTLER